MCTAIQLYTQVQAKKGDPTVRYAVTSPSKQAEIITREWPDNMKVLLDSLKLFFNYRDELTVQDGLILRGQRIVIPLSMQPKMQPSTCWPPRYTHVFKG